MIEELNHKNEKTAKDMLAIQQPAYRIEAEMMGFHGIPQLSETIADLQKSEETFIGYSEEELQGFISYREEEEGIDIYRLVVHPNHFRKGIARSLLTFLLEKYEGYNFIVSTGSANIPGRKLYEAFGFTEQKEFEVSPGIYCTEFFKKN